MKLAMSPHGFYLNIYIYIYTYIYIYIIQPIIKHPFVAVYKMYDA